MEYEYACMCKYTCIYMCVDLHVCCMPVNVFIYIHVNVYVSIYIWEYMYICKMYTYADTWCTTRERRAATATQCITLRLYDKLQYTATTRNTKCKRVQTLHVPHAKEEHALHYTTSHCNTRQHTATRTRHLVHTRVNGEQTCSTLQHAATHCHHMSKESSQHYGMALVRRID